MYKRITSGRIRPQQSKSNVLGSINPFLRAVSTPPRPAGTASCKMQALRRAGAIAPAAAASTRIPVCSASALRIAPLRPALQVSCEVVRSCTPCTRMVQLALIDALMLLGRPALAPAAAPRAGH